MKLRTPFVLSLVVLGMGVSPVLATTMDLSVSQGGISFAPMPFFVGQAVRIYTTVEQSGSSDAEGNVEFRVGNQLIGSKPISLKAGGRPEEAWVNWMPTQTGNQVVQVSVNGEQGVVDAVPGNNTVQEQVFVDQDTDHDGTGNQADVDDDNDDVVDTSDDFPLDPDRSHDTDGDGIDDAVDSDDDNDGVYDFEEIKQGTNPTQRDTDRDGVDDARDAYPTDPKRTVLESSGTTSGGGGTSGGGTSSPNVVRQPGRVLALEMIPSTSTISSLNADSDLVPRFVEMTSSSSGIESIVSATSSASSASDFDMPSEEREEKDVTSTSSIASQDLQAPNLSLDTDTGPLLVTSSIFSAFLDEGFLSLLGLGFLFLAFLFFLLYVRSKRR